MNIYLYKHETVCGPFTIPGIEAMLQEKQIELTDLATFEGEENWRSLAVILGIYNQEKDTLLKQLAEMEQQIEQLDRQFGFPSSTARGSSAADSLMDRINALKPGDFIRSPSSNAHFRDVVPAFDALGANRHGSRQILTPEGDPFMVDVYGLPDGREILAGYMDPGEKAKRQGLTSGPKGESLEAAVKRLIARQLEVDGGVAEVEMDDTLTGVKLGMDDFSAAELIMACEDEFGILFDDEAARITTSPGFTVTDLIVLVGKATTNRA